MSKVLIIGSGAAGMSAAIAAAYNGNEVFVFEKNEKSGKKIYITGKGRCNYTNASDIENHIANVNGNGKFLYSAFNALTPDDVTAMIESVGVKTKVERGNRAFPLSDKSSDIIYAFDKMMSDIGVTVKYNTEIKTIKKDKDLFVLKDDNNNEYRGDYCIIATGGLAYPSTGSTGDGYKFAKNFDIACTKLYPSLVPFNTVDEWCKKLQGLSLRNVRLKVFDDKKEYYNELGEMLFTHFGVSGPLVLSASTKIADKINNKIKCSIDLKPALSYKELDQRVLRDFNNNLNKNFNNALNKLLPLKLISVVIEKSGIDPYTKIHDITKQQREKLVDVIKNLEFEVKSLRSYSEAIITKGGIDLKEIKSKNMESKKVEKLYFVGEVLDVDSMTGGYNLQIAWSTGYLAGSDIY